jgi:hypothetical protein
VGGLRPLKTHERAGREPSWGTWQFLNKEVEVGQADGTPSFCGIRIPNRKPLLGQSISVIKM